MKDLMLAFKLIWLALVGLNVYWLVGCEASFAPEECRMLHWLVIGALCFPISILGLLMAVIVGWVLEVAGIISMSRPAPAVLQWIYLAALLGLAYAQWFYALPRLLDRFRRKNEHRKTRA
jgi:hypothetical protein